MEINRLWIERFLTGQISFSPVNRALMRGAVHVAVGLASAGALLLFPSAMVLVSLGVVTALVIFFDVIRLCIHAVNKWFFKWFALFVREKEWDRLTGASYFMLGCLLTVLIFPRNIACLAILFASLGDPSATIVGTWKGRSRFWGKSIEGSITCFSVCLIVATLVAAFVGKSLLLVAVAGAVFAVLFEALPLRLNDNIAVPFGSASVMAIIALLI